MFNKGSDSFVKQFLMKHPCASVFLGWSAVDILRMGYNLIKANINNHHVERVNEQRIKCRCSEDTLTYGCDVREQKDKTTEEEKQEEPTTEGEES